MISEAAYERLLEAAEDAQDAAAIGEATAALEAEEPTVPWSQVKADLGWA